MEGFQEVATLLNCLNTNKEKQGQINSRSSIQIKETVAEKNTNTLSSPGYHKCHKDCARSTLDVNMLLYGVSQQRQQNKYTLADVCGIDDINLELVKKEMSMKDKSISDNLFYSLPRKRTVFDCSYSLNERSGCQPISHHSSLLKVNKNVIPNPTSNVIDCGKSQLYVSPLPPLPYRDGHVSQDTEYGNVFNSNMEKCVTLRAKTQYRIQSFNIREENKIVPNSRNSLLNESLKPAKVNNNRR